MFKKSRNKIKEQLLKKIDIDLQNLLNVRTQIIYELNNMNKERQTVQ